MIGNARWCAASLTAAIVVVGSAAVSAAQSPAPAAASEPAGTAVVRGRVVAADTGKPLRRGRVSFTSIEVGGAPRSVTTGVDGRYEIKNLAAGRYNVSADRSGYLPLRYGQRRPLEAGRPLQVFDGQAVERVDFALPRTSLVSGHVVDEVGDAVAGATVFALRSEYWQGRRQLVPSGPAARTDDTGLYRVTGLAPGAYVLRATTRETWTVTRGGKKDVMGFAPTYFPGTPDLNVAQRLSVGVGQQMTGVDFALVPGRTVSVSGAALDSRGRPLTNILLAQSTLGPNGGQAGSGGGGQVAPDGTFRVRDVAPGEYTLVAAGSDEVARLPLVVSGSDIDGLALTGAGGWSASGVVTTESGAPPAVQTNRVRIGANMLAAVPGMRVQGEPEYAVTLKDDWTFSIGGISGPMRFRIGLPDGWAVKSILSRDRDVADAVIEPAAGGALSDVQIVLTNRVTTLSGQLVDRQGLPVDGTVIVFPSDSEKWTDGSRFVRAARPDQSGQFQIKGLPAGDYLAIAVDYVQDGLWNDPEYLKSMRQSAERFTLAEAESHALTLKLVAP